MSPSLERSSRRSRAASESPCERSKQRRYQGSGEGGHGGLRSEIMPVLIYLLPNELHPRLPKLLPGSWPGACRSPINLFSSFQEHIYQRMRASLPGWASSGPVHHFSGCSDFTSSERLSRTLLPILPLSADHLLYHPASLAPKRPSPQSMERPCVLTRLLSASSSRMEAVGESDPYLSRSSLCTQCL